ncbi:MULTISPECIES: DMT family transporter [unclassified Polaromonas]|jgi:drug/metabolite transporter (DMT)-like permease|uniref:DMT family transporter n=1 Tax=unclassified Polaromonas TaxID=2638319 RepID=UPI000BC94D44|nr:MULTISPECIES: DMT family transporter [unclassified Polaromonas]OYY39044.1 MAG: EamA family transporter [Polaromonas sp. 35-63-35]OYZ21909.1 MAG: EamA family transporter [Polaromonas sp. 16-63-31]OYZ80347.1 MAG: EamA family transporter [Polaromonas sp. 24-63-21]OZA51410.1 MAG: EamA family transporter [Polaromonas sp. 17-63-33]OZA90118.1 MAG: EamA family transporter [Polaromonas sp. 39-63-25]
MLDAAQRETRRALLLLWLVPALWAVNYIVARKAPGVIGPYMLALGRWGLAALILMVITRAELWEQRAAITRAWRQYLVLGTLGMLICGAWVYEGARSTGAMNIALIYSASPVLIALGAMWWLGEGFGARQAAGVLLALTGVVHVVVKGRWTALADVQFVAGDAWILAATVSWAAYALLQKRWPSSLSATARLAAICIGGTLVLLPPAVWEATRPGADTLGSQALLLVVVASLIPGVGAYWIYGWAQKILGASRVAVALYLGPLYAAGAAWLLGEPPGWHHAVGALLILPGVFLVTRPIKQPVKPQLPARS